MTQSICIAKNTKEQFFFGKEEKYACGKIYRFPKGEILLKTFKSLTNGPVRIILEWNDEGLPTQTTLVEAASEEVAWNEFYKNSKIKIVYKLSDIKGLYNCYLEFDGLD